jgi:amidase
MIKMIDAGLAVPKRQYDAARAVARSCRAQFDGLFRDVDVVVTPSAHGEAPEGTATGDPLFQRMWTVLHTPCVHLPMCRGSRGLPVGITVVGRLGGDRALLQAAEWIHELLGGRELTALAA